MYVTSRCQNKMHAQQRSNTDITLKQDRMIHGTFDTCLRPKDHIQLPLLISGKLANLDLGHCLSQGIVERILTQHRYDASVVEHHANLGAQMCDEQRDTTVLQGISAPPTSDNIKIVTYSVCFEELMEDLHRPRYPDK